MGYKSDIEIAQECEMCRLPRLQRKLVLMTIPGAVWKYKAKIDYNLLKESDKKDGKLILVTAINDPGW